MSGEGVTAEKARWRERFRAARRETPPEALARSSAWLCRRLEAVTSERAGPVALFWPLPGEPDLRRLAERLRQRGRTVALPAVVGARALSWRRFEGPERLVPGRWGLREPAEDAPPVAPEALAVVAVPGLAFGRDGTRLGYGGGFYDAALAATPALRVGVAAPGALVAGVPAEAHDARLDAVVTEREVWWVHGER